SSGGDSDVVNFKADAADESSIKLTDASNVELTSVALKVVLVFELSHNIDDGVGLS
ncbi:hypothetical protein BgiBS90_020775, partial [Biomphalaria glabrata]